MTYKQALIKRNIELALMFPFVLLGKLAGYLFTLSTQHHIFLFYPSADIGGSVKVNAEIAACIKEAKPLVIFSKKPKNNEFRKLFDIEGVRVLDLHRYIDNKLFHFVNFFFRGVLAALINKADNPVVFGGESLYFYKIIPHVKKGTKCIELIHLNTWFNFTQAFIDYIDLRIFSTPQIMREAENLYRSNNLPQKYFDKLKFIDNKIFIPHYHPVHNPQLEVVFVGRGAPQKRVYLIAEIAKRMHEAGKKVHISFVGDVEKIVPEEIQKYTTLYGNLDKTQLEKVYARSDVLLLTSAYEGLPIVVMDMMARGKVVVSTAVGGIPDYIENGKSGFLVYETDEQAIIEQSIGYLDQLINDPVLKRDLGKKAYDFAKTHFDETVFDDFYRGVILGKGR